MADLPSSSVSVSPVSALAQLGTDGFLLLFTAGAGAINEPRPYSSAAALLAEFKDCHGVEFGTEYIKRTKKPIVALRMTTVTAGSVANLDTTGVTGLCVITAAAHGNGIHDEADIVLDFPTGGEVGVDGIEYRYSIDGGKNFSPLKKLGTATTIDLARLGVRFSLTAATIEDGDQVTCYTIPSKYDAAGILAAFVALKAHKTLFRGGIVMGEVTPTDAANWQASLADYDTFGRPMWLIMSARDWYHDANFEDVADDIDFASSGHTITRNTGSWISDGFQVGDVVTVSGSALNNGAVGTLTAVTATVLTFAAGVVSEPSVNGAGLTITGVATMAGSPSDVDFDGSAHTITRNTGSWITDGFRVGQTVTASGTTLNNSLSRVITAISATVLTFAAGVVTESNVNAPTVIGTATMAGAPSDIDFTASGHTITRDVGSWVTDGFKVGMTVTIEGSSSNEGAIGKLTAVTATVLTFASGVVDESNAAGADLTITAEELEADWQNQIAEDFEAKVYDDPWISILGGRGQLSSRVLGTDIPAEFRRPDAWADAITEMKFGPQIMTSKIENGAILGGEFTILDDGRNTVEHDEQLNPGLTNAGIGSVRSLDQEEGVFISLPLMRASNPNSALSRRPIRSVINIFCQVVQKETQRFMSREVQKKKDGTIAEVEAKRLELKVNTALKRVLLGPINRLASGASWTMKRDDDLSVPGATVHGEGVLNTLGYLEKFDTTARIASSAEG